jgi:hypothetical protein
MIVVVAVDVGCFGLHEWWPPGPSKQFLKVARFCTAEDQSGENTGDHHNPTRQRGISLNTS